MYEGEYPHAHAQRRRNLSPSARRNRQRGVGGDGEQPTWKSPGHVHPAGRRGSRSSCRGHGPVWEASSRSPWGAVLPAGDLLRCAFSGLFLCVLHTDPRQTRGLSREPPNPRVAQSGVEGWCSTPPRRLPGLPLAADPCVCARVRPRLRGCPRRPPERSSPAQPHAPAPPPPDLQFLGRELKITVFLYGNVLIIDFRFPVLSSLFLFFASFPQHCKGGWEKKKTSPWNSAACQQF